MSKLTEKELCNDLDDFASKYLKPAFNAIASNIDNEILKQKCCEKNGIVIYKTSSKMWMRQTIPNVMTRVQDTSMGGNERDEPRDKVIDTDIESCPFCGDLCQS